MRLGSRGLGLIKSFESLRLEAYQDSVGVWTIGYGHTGPEVGPGSKMTETEAEQQLRRDVAEREPAISALLRDGARPSEFDALLSFAFNLGVVRLKGSTLLMLHNQGDRLGAAKQFPLWDRAGGRELRGLLRRRFAEAALYLEDN